MTVQGEALLPEDSIRISVTDMKSFL